MLVIHSKVFTVPMVTSCHISSRYEKYKNNKAHSYYWQQKYMWFSTLNCTKLSTVNTVNKSYILVTKINRNIALIAYYVVTMLDKNKNKQYITNKMC